MIQTKEIISYGDRSEKQGKIMIEVRPLEMTKLGNKYLVIDWDISFDIPQAISSKEVFYDNEKVNQLDVYLESTNDFTGMTKSEKEVKKVKLALMLDTQTNLFPSGKTIYRLTQTDWEFSTEE